MDASDPQALDADPIKEQLDRVFGSYRAEWLDERLFDFFTAPAYLPELTTARPCVLIGGRGTGKTTVLRGLSYLGQDRLLAGSDRGLTDREYYGVYIRVDTNRVTAFDGPELDESGWRRLFGHYWNLLVCGQLARFMSWFAINTGQDQAIPPEALEAVCEALSVPSAATATDLSRAIVSATRKLEVHVNNVSRAHAPMLSMPGAPVEAMVEAMASVPELANRLFFILVDEYENLLNYQQRAINTLIKHSAPRYTYKVGCKELGFREHATVNADEQLVHPADYVRVDIGSRLQGPAFAVFAEKVCSGRLQAVVGGEPWDATIRSLLPGLTEQEEAVLLGAEGAVEAALAEPGAPMWASDPIFSSASPLHQLVLLDWAKVRGADDAWKAFSARSPSWSARVNNFGHATLYGIHGKKRGIGKYYCGWSTFCELASGNIRYLLQLVDLSVQRHIGGGGLLGEPVSVVVQTVAAQDVGRINLAELEGLAVEGAQLTKLALGLGRVFGVMAGDATGHAPEVTQFYLRDDPARRTSQVTADRVDGLLRAGVMHLALQRHTGSKLMSPSDTREYDYQLHPIYAAFFEMSWRRKRKMKFTYEAIEGLVDRPREAIAVLLADHGREGNEDLPDQLKLFGTYYAGE